MKRIISVLLTMALLFSSMCLVTEPVHAATNDWEFYGSTCTSSASAASTINYIRAKYDQYSTYTGEGQCFGWAEKVSNMLASERTYKEFKSLKFNKKNFKAKCLNIKAGAHLRLSHEKEYNPWSGHSICLLKVTNNQVCWTDNNYAGYETIAYYSATLEQFVNYYGQYEYLNMLTKTKTYKTQKEPLLAIEKTADGRAKLFWTKTSNTSKYKVYRATSKNGTYKRIKTTTGRNFVDTTAAYGKKYYYKVTSVKKYTSDKTSNKSSCTARLNTPAITDWTNASKSGKIQIFWKKVKNADKYYVYRSRNGGKYTYFATTKKCTFTDNKAADPTVNFSYKVRAVYAKNKKGNSYCSEPTYALNTRVAAPKLKYTYDKATGQLTLSWNKVPYAGSYNIRWYQDGNYGTYSTPGSVEERTYTVNVGNSWYFNPGSVFEFVVVAYPKEYGYSSIESNKVKITAPEVSEGDDAYDYWY